MALVAATLAVKGSGVRIPSAPLLLLRRIGTVPAARGPAHDSKKIFIDHLLSGTHANWSETGAGGVRTRNGVNDPLLLVRVAVRGGLVLFEPVWCSSLARLPGGRSLLADP